MRNLIILITIAIASNINTLEPNSVFNATYNYTLHSHITDYTPFTIYYAFNTRTSQYTKLLNPIKITPALTPASIIYTLQYLKV